MLPDPKRAAHKSDITFLSSTVTVVLLVVLLTFEALVVALVADVVLATYPSRHVNRKATKKITPVHN